MRRGCLIWNLVVFLLLVLSVLFPASGEAVSDFNVETDGVKKLLYITDEEEVELQYPVQNESIKKLILYFDVAIGGEKESGNSVPEENGTIGYTIKDETGALLYENSVSVNQIIHEKTKGMLIGTDLPVEMTDLPGQVVTITLRGEGIPNTTRVRLLGNGNRESRLVIVRYGAKYPNYPLFQMKTESKERPYTWDLLMILFVTLIVTVLTKERANGTGKKRKTSVA